MVSRVIRSLHLVVFLFLSFVPRAFSSQLIWTYHYEVQGQFSAANDCNNFTFTIGHSGSHELGDVLLTPWPPPFQWQDGYAGLYDFDSSFDQPPFNYFSQMATSITDGINESMFFKGSVWNCNQKFPPSPYISESSVFQSPTDLVGNNIDLIRLRIDGLHLQSSGAQTQFDLPVTYEFWGSPLPEPMSGASLALLAIVGSQRNHRRWRPRRPRAPRHSPQQLTCQNYQKPLTPK
jgi:hypothetical protein